MNLVIPDYVLQNAALSEQQLAIEIAVVLFEKKIVGLKAASKIANLQWFEFQQILAERKISVVQYDIEDIRQDLANLKDL